MKIFISYRRADSTYLVGRIRDRLMVAFGEGTVFRDLDDIPSGVDFRTVLEEETNGCDVMLVIMGPQWAGITDAEGNKRLFNSGDFTRIEVETGLKRLGKDIAAVFPVLVMNAQMPSPKELPESLSQLTYQNAISIRNDPDFNNDIERLIRDIRHSRGVAEGDMPREDYEPVMIYIGEGPFLMGGRDGKDTPPHETPQKEISIPAYRIGKYPVMNSEYELFIRETGKLVASSMGWDGQRVPSGFGRHPVAGVTFYDALAYCRWLTGKTGHNYMIPNEAQWEKACRGASGGLYPWGDEYDPARCNLGKSGLAMVDAYIAQNDYGLFDLVGNVRQWTCSLWGEKSITPDQNFAYPWQEGQRNDPTANGLIRRVLRGASYTDNAKRLRCSARSGHLPTDAGSPGAGNGFRVVMAIAGNKV